MKKYLFSLSLISAFSAAQIPAGYYNGTENISGYALKSKLHEIISQNYINWHYGDLQNFYNSTDLDRYYDHDASNSTILLDIYSENPAGADAYEYTAANATGSANAEGQGWNREHAMPQSSFGSNYPMYSDLFFVIPTDARINQLRSNYPYGIAGSTNYYTFTNGSKISNNATPNSNYTGRVYEPINEFKGDVARMLLYFAIRYEGKLNTFKYFAGTTTANDTNPLDGTEEKAFENWYIALLKQWSAQDPVSQREIDRNNAVYAIQKNRNPLIDHPEWVEKIWSGSSDTVAPASVTASLGQVSAYFAKINWNASADADVLGYKIYVNGTLYGTSKTTETVLDHLNPNINYTVTVKPYDASYNDGADSNSLTFSTLNTDSYSKDLLISKYIEGSGNNKAIEITNNTGHDVNLSNYRLNIQMKSGTNYYFPAPYELEGTVKSGEKFLVVNPNASFTCFQNSSAKFQTAAPQLTFSGSNYVELSYKITTVDAVGVKDTSNSDNLQNASLYRLPSVSQPTASFTIGEWQKYPQDYCADAVLGASDVLAENNFTVYPNPATDKIFIKGLDAKDQALVQIFDASGKLIVSYKNAFSQRDYVDVASLKPGLYFIITEGKKAKFIKK